MQKKIAFFDVDGVIYDGHSIFDLIQDQEKRGFIKEGLWNKISAEIDRYKKGQKNYKDAANEMLKQYAIFVKGKSYSDLLADASVFFC
jgi:FMN phosphatase YigB (HAD superfamily)